MPPTEVITVEFAALRAAADSLLGRAKALGGHLDQLQQQLVPIKETWYASGSSAGEAAEQSESKLRAAIADVIGIIGQFSTKVNEAHDLQVQVENKITTYFA